MITPAAQECRRTWETPSDQFIGVPYVGADGNHPHRLDAPARPGHLKGYRHLAGTGHRLLPADAQVARLAEGTGFVLLDGRGNARALYHRRFDGWLLHVSPALRRRGLGHRFLAACLDLQEESGATSAWHPGSYSDAGLRTALRAHRLLVLDAVGRAQAVPPEVLAKVAWHPQPIPARPLARADVRALRRLAGEKLDYKEAMVVLALLHGPGAKIEGVFDMREADPRAFTFLLALGHDHYQGFDRIRRQEVIAGLVEDARESMRPVRPEDLAFRTVSIEQVCSHKHFWRDAARNFLERAAARRAGSPPIVHPPPLWPGPCPGDTEGSPSAPAATGSTR